MNPRPGTVASGEQSSMTMRLPRSVKERLLALATVEQRSMVELVTDAFEALWAARPAATRKAADALVKTWKAAEPTGR